MNVTVVPSQIVSVATFALIATPFAEGVFPLNPWTLFLSGRPAFALRPNKIALKENIICFIIGGKSRELGMPMRATASYCPVIKMHR